MDKKYKIISLDLQKSLIEFLDEIQFDAAKDNDKESMHKINFCNYAIKELMDSIDGILKEKPGDTKPQKKSSRSALDTTQPRRLRAVESSAMAMQDAWRSHHQGA